jgi:hypothetical protein
VRALVKPPQASRAPRPKPITCQRHGNIEELGSPVNSFDVAATHLEGLIESLKVPSGRRKGGFRQGVIHEFRKVQRQVVVLPHIALQQAGVVG